MKLSTVGPDPLTYNGDLLVIARTEGGTLSSAETALDKALNGALSAAVKRLNFKGKTRQTVALDTLGYLGVSRVLLLGLGKTLSPVALRDYAALAAVEATNQHFESVGLVPPNADAETVWQLGCGAITGIYRFDDLKAADPDAPAELVRFDLLTDADVLASFEQGGVAGKAVNLARTLTNEPPNVCTPERLADTAVDIAKAPHFTVTILDREAIHAKKMGGLIAVSQGATRAPRFIHMHYAPPSAKGEAIALVGKGITFDSGGLSLKPPKSQIEMYIDMGGAAAVIGAMRAIADLQPNVEIHGIVAACENMPGGNSYRPSDILTMYSGKTVEVLNTDAEGRLVLADAIHYATELKPRVIIDLATLTGACMVGLGPNYGGLFSDDDALADEVLAAAKVADENLWRLPLDPKLAKTLKSKRADITNLGGPWGGAITAAQFLQNFKGDTGWVHLDIAGAVLTDKHDGHIRAGGTGFAVLTLLALAQAAAG